MEPRYLFTSKRLGFRNWCDEDRLPFAKLNSDKRVMKHFPSILNASESDALVDRMMAHYDLRGYTYFAVDILQSNQFIGFIGLAYQDYPTEFNPSVDIGWRLDPSAWGFGYATEGGNRCLKFGFERLQLERINAICTVGNDQSERVMKKLGMRKMTIFEHPKLEKYPNCKKCLLYSIRSSDYKSNE